jgi:TolB protein
MFTRTTSFVAAAAVIAGMSAGCASRAPVAGAGEGESEQPRTAGRVNVNDPFALSVAGPPSHGNVPAPHEVIMRTAFADTRGPGGNLAQITFSLDGADFDPDVSRDGRWIVFASTQHRMLSDIYIKEIGSRVVTQLTNEPAHDVMPKISPDGTRIAFASNRTGFWNIYVMPITGGRAMQLTSGTADDLHPSWSPDGSQLVFCRLGEVSGQWELWITELANPGVARFIGNGLFPQWCPVAGTGLNGADKIAFQRSRERGDRSFSIWTIDVKGGQAFNQTEIASSPMGACINPAWSPDGQWLAFATVPNPGEWASIGRPPASDLHLVNLMGSNRVMLTSGVGVNLMPTWSGNERLFFVSNRAGTENVWAMDTSAVMQLARANAGQGNIASTPGGVWSPGAQWSPGNAWSPSVVTVPPTLEEGPR